MAANDLARGELSVTRNLEMDGIFGRGINGSRGWTPAGEAPCRVGQCFVLEHVNEPDQKILIDKSTYDVTTLVYPRKDDDGQPVEYVVQVFGWGEDPSIEAPSGNVIEA